MADGSRASSRTDHLDVSIASTASTSLSPQSAGNDEAPEVVAGLLDLSKRGLTKLSKKHIRICGTATALDISRNSFKFINGVASFVRLTEMNASFNSLERLSGFQPLAKTLRSLDVSHNDVHNVDALPSLVALTYFDGSHNRIQTLPNLDRLANLSRVDLSSNLLKSLPRLVRMQQLVSLNLSANKISALDDCGHCLPLSLQELDISENSICDLRQALHLSCLTNLHSLALYDNPCVRSEGRTFDYRPFLFCCVPNSLQLIDHFQILEVEILKGERLQTHGKFRRFQCHADLAAYLTRECPFDAFSDEHASVSSADEEILKVLKKRRELLSPESEPSEASGATSLGASPSPYREWLWNSAKKPTRRSSSVPLLQMHEEHKENCPPPADSSVVGDSPDDCAVVNTPVSGSSTASNSTVILSREERLQPIPFMLLTPTKASMSERGGTSEKGASVPECLATNCPSQSLTNQNANNSFHLHAERCSKDSKEEVSPCKFVTPAKDSASARIRCVELARGVDILGCSPSDRTSQSSSTVTPDASPASVSERISAVRCSTRIASGKPPSLQDQTPLRSNVSRPVPAPRRIFSNAQSCNGEYAKCERSCSREAVAARSIQSEHSTAVIVCADLLTKEPRPTQLQYWWRGVQMRQLKCRMRNCEERCSQMERTIGQLCEQNGQLKCRICNCEERCSQMESTIDELCEQNGQLSRINVEKDRVIEQMGEYISSMAAKTESLLVELNLRSRLNSIEGLLSKALPVPSSLQFKRTGPTEVLVEWVNVSPMQPAGYSVLVDGASCGDVQAASLKTLVQDLDPASETEIRIQCIMEDGTKGEKSKPLIIPPYPQRLRIGQRSLRNRSDVGEVDGSPSKSAAV